MGGLEALQRRVTCEGEVRKRAPWKYTLFPAVRFRDSKFGMRRKPVRAQAQEVYIMTAVGGLS